MEVLFLASVRNGRVKGVLKENSCGIVVDSGDADGLAKAIKTAMKNKSLLKKYAFLGRDIVENRYSDTSMAKNIYNVYKKVISIE
jgi:glycosyltransferase involved in cell wall biosynthesis